MCKSSNILIIIIILTTILLLPIPFRLIAQEKIAGHFRNFFGSRIELNPDKTFKYTWHFDLSVSWTKGTWTLLNDTVYFHIVPTYDTISYKDKDGAPVDKLILSADEIPERLTPEQYSSIGLSSGGQNFYPCPDKLFYSRQKLFAIKNGNLVKKKVRDFGTKKKWRPWFFKSDDI